MAVTPGLRRYLELERLMLWLDAVGDSSADGLRDLMDPLWYGLSDDERRVLDQRTVGVITSLEAIRVPAEESVFGVAPSPPPPRLLPLGPITGWKSAA